VGSANIILYDDVPRNNFGPRIRKAEYSDSPLSYLSNEWNG
jgi:hypothetical protein